MMMEEKAKKKKTIIVSLIGVLLLIVLAIGIAYAAFAYTKTGAKVNSIVTGILDMSYTEDSNAISIMNAVPLSDEDGKTQTGSSNVFDFTVGVTDPEGVTVNYMITVAKNSSSTLPDSAVKLYLTSGASDTQVLAPIKMSELSQTTSSNNAGAPAGEYILYSDSTTSSSSTTYHLRLWLASDYTGSDIASPSYRLKVNVYGRAEAL